jgi:HAD superfamily hydrolase (TIGR01484 family)
MRPLSELSRDACRNLQGVLADIDDTLTTHGRLPAKTLVAIEALKHAGLVFIPITGRPAGWCDHIARMWPVDAVVGENGAFFMRYDMAARKLVTQYVVEPAARAAQHAQLLAIGERILREVPGSAWASDQAFRVADIAIDFCEDVPALPRASIDAIAEIMRASGLTAKVSSIHVNGWFGDYDKLSTTKQLLASVVRIPADIAQSRYAFVGDSANDATMFNFFSHSVGVANVREQAAWLTHPPKYVTPSRSADGFVELAQHILQHRS